MPFKKSRRPNIPPGAPGHPRTGTEAGPARAPRAATRESRITAPKPARPSPARSEARLVYEDETILAYDKPVGLPVIAPDGSRTRCLLDVATERVARHNSRGRAAVVHRIDRDTSGIVIFAVDGRTKKLLMDGWDELVTQRLYVALVEGQMAEGSGVFDSWLKENKAGEVYVAEPKDKGAKRAVTRWRVLEAGPGPQPPRARPRDGSQAPDPRPARRIGPRRRRRRALRFKSRARRSPRGRPGAPLPARAADRAQAAEPRSAAHRKPSSARIRCRRRRRHPSHVRRYRGETPASGRSSREMTARRGRRKPREPAST